MSQTLVATFHSVAEAQRAVERLVADGGFERSAIDVKTTDDTTPAQPPAGLDTTAEGSGSRMPAAHEEPGVLESIGRFFSDLFGPNSDERDYASHYAEAVRRGKAIVTVEIDDSAENDRMDVASMCLLDAGAIDIDDHVLDWRGEGYEPASSASSTSPSGLATPDAIAVSEEPLTNAGSSSVVFPNAGAGPATPRPSDRERDTTDVAASAATAPARSGDTVEAGQRRSTTSDPRRVRVVWRDAANRSDVSSGMTAGGMSAAGTASISAAAALPPSASPAPTTASSTATASTTASYDAQRERFRSDYEANYASSGQTFDAYEPAYRSGHALRSDERHRDKSWEEVEPIAREQWEASNPDTWERMRDAHRRGWDWDRS